MARCDGDQPISAKVDRSMLEFIDREAERCGLTRAEVIRRLCDDFRESRNGNLRCPRCHNKVIVDPCP